MSNSSYNGQMIPAIIADFKILFLGLEPFLDEGKKFHINMLYELLEGFDTEVKSALEELAYQRNTAVTKLSMAKVVLRMKDYGLRQLKREMEEQAAANEDTRKVAAEQFGKVLDGITDKLSAATDTIAKLRAENAELTKQVNELTPQQETEQPPVPAPVLPAE